MSAVLQTFEQSGCPERPGPIELFPTVLRCDDPVPPSSKRKADSALGQCGRLPPGATESTTGPEKLWLHQAQSKNAGPDVSLESSRPEHVTVAQAFCDGSARELEEHAAHFWSPAPAGVAGSHPCTDYLSKVSTGMIATANILW